MKQYIDLINRTIKDGEVHENRTGINTIRTTGEMMSFNLEEGFPAVTTKKLAFKSVIGELCAFMRGSMSAADFRALGSKVWDQNANENKAWLENPFREGPDDLGPVYGAQWRKWPAFKVVPVAKENDSDKRRTQLIAQENALLADGWSLYAETLDGDELEERDEDGDEHYGFLPDGVIYRKEIDQFGDCLKKIINDPDNRRILFHGWNPAELGSIALAACHILYQFIPNKATGKMDTMVYVRSNDIFLGAPFNIASAAAMAELVARLTGYTAKKLTIFIGDCHIYENHLQAVATQVSRTPLALPKLVISDRIPKFEDTGVLDLAILDTLTPDDFSLEGYEHHPAITAPMAV